MNAVYKMQGTAHGTADTYGIDDKAYHGSFADCGKPCLSYESAYSQYICNTIKGLQQIRKQKRKRKPD